MASEIGGSARASDLFPDYPEYKTPTLSYETHPNYLKIWKITGLSTPYLNNIPSHPDKCRDGARRDFTDQVRHRVRQSPGWFSLRRPAWCTAQSRKRDQNTRTVEVARFSLLLRIGDGSYTPKKSQPVTAKSQKQAHSFCKEKVANTQEIQNDAIDYNPNISVRGS